MRTNPFVPAMILAAALFSGGCASVCSWSNPRFIAAHAAPDAPTAELAMAFGRILEARGDLEHAMAAYRHAARCRPERADIYLRMAVLHDKLGQFARSAAKYRKAIQRDPGNPEIFADVGFSLYLQERWDDAEMNLRQALAIDPNLPRAHNNLALVLAQTGRIDEALAEFQRGGCDWADAHTNVAFVMTTLGNHELAEMHDQLAWSNNEHGDIEAGHGRRVPVLFPPIAPPSDERTADARAGNSAVEHSLAERAIQAQ